MSEITSDPHGNWMTHDTARNTAQFVLETLQASGGTVNYSRFYNRGDAFLDEMELSTFWMFDVVLGALEAAGVVVTQTLNKELGDDTYDYSITLVGEPTIPYFETIEERVWTMGAKMPSGFRYVE